MSFHASENGLFNRISISAQLSKEISIINTSEHAIYSDDLLCTNEVLVQVCRNGANLNQH